METSARVAHRPEGDGYPIDLRAAADAVEDRGLDDDYERLRLVAEDFARQVLAPCAADRDADGDFPYDIVRHMGEIGLFGLPFPERLGGRGGDFFGFCLALEELARVDASVAVTLESAVVLGATALYRFGTRAQREAWMPDLVTGRALAAYAHLEPAGGLDGAALRTRARAVEGGWLLDGTKCLVANAGTNLTRLVVVTAVTDGPGTADAPRPAGTAEAAAPEVSAFIVPVPAAGVAISAPQTRAGWRTVDTREVGFAGVHVPARDLLGAHGSADGDLRALQDVGRVAVAAIAAGIAQGCLDVAVAHTDTRNTVREQVGTGQAARYVLADMAVRVHTARLAYYDAAARMLRGRPFARQAAMATLHATTMATANAEAATQLHGGPGYVEDTPVARYWRDAKALEVGEATGDVRRMLMA